MGCINSKPADPADKDASQQNAKIDRMIRNDKKTLDRTIKILLLGMHIPTDFFSFARQKAQWL